MADPDEINIAVAEALGLDPTKIKREGITIRLTNAGPEVDVRFKARTYEEAEALVETVKRYRLVEIEDEAE